jgi:dCMP deaminase
MVSDRPDWDQFWFLQALMYSTRGTCDRLRCACVIVNDKRIVGAGYNGSVFGQPHCDDVGHLLIDNHCERTLHGEENAVLNSDRSKVKGATSYSIGTPCLRCTKLLINSGVKEIKYLGQYANSRGKEHIMELAKAAGVTLVETTLDPRNIINLAIKRLEGAGGL